MKVFRYLQSIFDKRDVKVVEEEITPLPLLCETCGKPSTHAVVTYRNSSGFAKDLKDCEQTMHLYCNEHGTVAQ